MNIFKFDSQLKDKFSTIYYVMSINRAKTTKNRTKHKSIKCRNRKTFSH